ncbi:MAG: flagellar basal body rod protein FlgC [Anaerovoracaceae bacterium]
MAFLSSMNISGSALTAEKARLNIIAENISNIDTTRTEDGGPYTRKLVVFQAQESETFRSALYRRLANTKIGLLAKDAVNEDAGVKVHSIVDDTSDYKRVYEPENPDADEDGYVLYPNVDIIKETVDAMAATRAYQANITALNSIQTMASAALQIGQ